MSVNHLLTDLIAESLRQEQKTEVALVIHVKDHPAVEDLKRTEAIYQAAKARLITMTPHCTTTGTL